MTDEPTPGAGDPSPTSWSLDDQAMRRLVSALRRVGDDEPPTELDAEPTTEDDRIFGESGAELASRPPRELGEGARLGRFQLERELGRGGFGVVHLAMDERLGRRVALKTPRPDRVQNTALWKRFAREARLAAALDHSAIVPVLEAGIVDETAYIASAYQEGRSLSQWLAMAREGFPPTLAAGIAEQLASGLTHAHQRGVLHRDLKPGNVIMIGQIPQAGGGFPSPSAVRARITDFGLGSFDVGDDGATPTGHWMGSPPYMAPEQALGGDRPIDVRADIYALGAILYEMLTGRPIHPRGDLTDLAIRLSRGESPPRPRQLRRWIPRDLETICLKCLAHEPAKRYASASELRDDLRRQLDGRPITARRAPWPERLARWARRHPSRAALVGVLLLGAATGTAMVARHHAELSVSNVRLENLNQQLRTALKDLHERDKRLEREIHAADLAAAQAELAAGDVESAQWILSRYFPRPGEPDHRGFVWGYLWAQATREYSVRGPLESPLDFIGPEPKSEPWTNLSSTEFQREIGGVTRSEIWDGPPPGPHSFLTLSPDGQILTLSDSNWRVANDEKILSLDRRKLASTSTNLRELIRLPMCHRLSFSADGGTLAALAWLPSDELCAPLVCDLKTGRGVVFPELQRRRELVGTPPHTAGYQLPAQLAVSPDGRRLAIGLADDSPLQLVDASDGRVMWSIEAETPEEDFVIASLAFSPSGARLVAGDASGRTRLWDVETGREIASAPFVTNRVGTVGFYPDEETVVVMTINESRVRSWPIHPRTEPRPVFDHGAEVWGIAFIPGTDLLATGGDDHLIELWDVSEGTKVATLETDDTMVTSLSATPDGRLLAASDMEGRLWLFDPSEPEKPGRRLPDHPGRVRRIVWSPDGQRLAIVGRAPTARIWDRRTERIIEFTTPHGISAYSASWSPDGASLAIGGHDGQISLWKGSYEAPDAILHAGQRVNGLAFSPDGQTLVAANDAGGLQAWTMNRPNDPPLTIRRNSQVGGLWGLIFSPDGRALVAGDDGGNVSFWDPTTLREVCRIRDHLSNKVYALTFSPDGRQLATADFNGKIIVHKGAEITDPR